MMTVMLTVVLVLAVVCSVGVGVGVNLDTDANVNVENALLIKLNVYKHRKAELINNATRYFKQRIRMPDGNHTYPSKITMHTMPTHYE